MLDNMNDLEIDNVDNLEQDIFDDSDKDLEVNFEDEKDEADDHILSLGQALNEKELYRLSSKVPTHIIYVLGPVGSGKTTFESMLYAFFLKNIDKNILFAGSETLVGFEERLNYLRIKSGNSDAQMERTNKDERRCFLHMNLLDLKSNCHYNLILSDVSGETFENCNSNRSNMEQDLPCLDMAKNIVLFMDGESLLDNSKRQGSVMKIKFFLKTFKSSRLYSEKTNIDIVISKNDVIYAKTKQNKNDFIENIKDQFRSFENDYIINYFRIEAINGSGIKDTEKSTELIDLLKYWITNKSKVIKELNNKGDKEIHNDFNRFGERY